MTEQRVSRGAADSSVAVVADDTLIGGSACHDLVVECDTDGGDAVVEIGEEWDLQTTHVEQSASRSFDAHAAGNDVNLVVHHPRSVDTHIIAH